MNGQLRPTTLTFVYFVGGRVNDDGTNSPTSFRGYSYPYYSLTRDGSRLTLVL